MLNEAVDERDCDLGWSVAMLMRDYKTLVEPVVADLPRGSRGFQLLYTVARKRIRTQVQLADYLGVDRSVIPYVIDDLVDAGLVDRQPDPADRRVRTVVVTAAGSERLQQLEARIAEAETIVLGALAAGEQEQFRSLLSRVARQARDHTTPFSAPPFSEEI
ncbi:MarR family winged helix-turn-helix transcriptional regulator [Rhodococcus sp. NM-2]|uniref:MarR family winged helix-turn-helix transcriptional regulator n=1 Tax=Rhodococcus sp. NM-2 TaxID=3401174 RepID=UPI003AAC66F4